MPACLHLQALVLLAFICLFGVFTGEMHTQFGWWTFTWFKSPAARHEGSSIALQIEGEESADGGGRPKKKKDAMKAHSSHLRCKCFCSHECLQCTEQAELWDQLSSSHCNQSTEAHLPSGPTLHSFHLAPPLTPSIQPHLPPLPSSPTPHHNPLPPVYYRYYRITMGVSWLVMLFHVSTSH